LDCLRQLAGRFFETFRQDAQRLEQVSELCGVHVLMQADRLLNLLAYLPEATRQQVWKSDDAVWKRIQRN
jgi:hypothetical protein